MWDLPEPEIEPVSLALVGGFLTNGPPGKPCLKVGLRYSSQNSGGNGVERSL